MNPRDDTQSPFSNVRPGGPEGEGPRYLAEEEKEKSEARLQQGEKIESLAVLAGGISHEFNNILTGILGRADLALLDLPPDSPVREHVQQIIVGGQRAAALTAQLLAYAGGGAHQARVLDLSHLVGEMAEVIGVAAPACTVSFELVSHLPSIEGDGNQLRQVILDLVGNAAEALEPTGGPILIKTGMRFCDQAFLANCHFVGGAADRDYVFLDVVDRGCGMAAEVRDRMFDPFFSTKFIGRGLGLAFVLGIVRRHGGLIHIISAPGRGTTVQVFLPTIAS